MLQSNLDNLGLKLLIHKGVQVVQDLIERIFLGTF